MPTFQTLDEVMTSYPDRFYPEKATGVDGVIQFIFTGDRGGEYHLVIRDGTLDVVAGEHHDPTVTVMTPAEAWIDVNNGDSSPLHLLMQGKLKVKGSLAMAGKFQSMFKPGSAL